MKYLVLLLLAVMTAQASAAIINVRPDNVAGHHGTSHDPVTGKYYQSESLNSPVFKVFANESDFRSGVIERQFSAQRAGTYFEVINDKLYTRTGSIYGNTVSVYDVNTLAALNTISIPQLSPANGWQGGFTWGGGASLNFISDDLDLYMFGRSSSSQNFLLLSMNKDDLSVQNVINTGITDNVLYASIVNGVLFTQANNNNTGFAKRYDIASNALTSINLSLDIGNGLYITNMNYTKESDTLYYSNYTQRTISEIQNASLLLSSPIPQSNTEVTEVPEPATLGLLGLSALLLMRRKGLASKK